MPTKPPGLDRDGLYVDRVDNAFVIEGQVKGQPTVMQLGDRLPALAASLYRADGVPVDLTGATVTFVLRRRRDRTAKVDGAAAVVVDALEGRVSYAWGAGDTSEPGYFDAFFRVTSGGGLTESFPSSRGHEVVIEP